MRKNITRSDIATIVSQKLGVSKEVSSEVIDLALKAIADSVIGGNNVEFRGFGTFTVKQRAASTRRNFSKGTTMKVPAHNVFGFKPSKALNIKLNK